MKITVDIPDLQWADMLRRAEDHGLKVEDLIRAGITEVLPRNLPADKKIILMVKAGFPDRIIAERLGFTNAAVIRVRHREKLPANRGAWRREAV